jgi:hypothetical protein
LSHRDPQKVSKPKYEATALCFPTFACITSFLGPRREIIATAVKRGLRALHQSNFPQLSSLTITMSRRISIPLEEQATLDIDDMRELLRDTSFGKAELEVKEKPNQKKFRIEFDF